MLDPLPFPVNLNSKRDPRSTRPDDTGLNLPDYLDRPSESHPEIAPKPNGHGSRPLQRVFEL
jgi:hypothetical protein